MGGNPSDFFERRDQSRRRTSLLVVLFSLAVIATILGIYLCFQLIISKGGFFGNRDAPTPFVWEWYWFWRISALTGAIILGGTIYRLAELMSGGGPAIARMLGATEVDQSTRDPLLRRLLNIVAEMSIASGAPAPTVYLLKKERSINAFAAGLGFEDAVIAVTDGALRNLSREELQGVVAHEFSHVLNGDSKLNIHLMGWLNGIMMISAIGRVIMRASLGSNDRGRNRGVFFGVAAGFILFILGLIGYFFARLIQMAVSRQREYLADASAVQFTRNPRGLAGALKKIGGFERGGMIDAANAEQAAHLFFGDALAKGFFRLWSTHPPLEERIRLLEPGWRGDFEAATPVEITNEAARERFMREEGVASAVSSVDASFRGCTPARVANSVGRPTSDHFERAASMLEAANPLLLDSARTGGGAMALVCALLLDGDDEVRKKQMLAIERRGGPKLAAASRRIAAILGAHGREIRLPLVDICLPAIKKLDNQSLNLLLGLMDELIEADSRVNAFELAVRAIMGRRIRKLLGMKSVLSPGALKTDLSSLLCVLANQGADTEAEAKVAFAAALGELGVLGRDVEWRPVSEASPQEFGAAAARLSLRSFGEKRWILKAMVAAATADSIIRVAEAELVRAGAELMDVPVPPLICNGE